MAGPWVVVRDTLIVTLQAELDDEGLARLRTEIAERVAHDALAGVVIDVSALDVLDSFSTRTLVSLVRATKAPTVVVGIQPDVALAMVKLGLNLDGIDTALDREEGLELLEAKRGPRGA